MSRAAFIEAARDPSFPKKQAKGWPIAACKAWLKKHTRGPYRSASTGRSPTLAAAKLAYLEERTKRERIAVERETLTQAIELGQIVWQQDAIDLMQQTAGTWLTCLDSFHDHIDRALGDAPDNVRGQVLTALDRAVSQVRQSVLDVLAKEEAA